MTLFIDEEGDELTYEKPHHIKFVEDMETHGIPWRQYKGRYSYAGPAATTDSLNDSQDIIRSTTVKLVSDGMGLETIWYPG
tara:strand:- start:503 stop:745 length:243 start_codon:yes stop_codon:yes gene_type:complete